MKNKFSKETFSVRLETKGAWDGGRPKRVARGKKKLLISQRNKFLARHMKSENVTFFFATCASMWNLCGMLSLRIVERRIGIARPTETLWKGKTVCFGWHGARLLGHRNKQLNFRAMTTGSYLSLPFTTLSMLNCQRVGWTEPWRRTGKSIARKLTKKFVEFTHRHLNWKIFQFQFSRNFLLRVEDELRCGWDSGNPL